MSGHAKKHNPESSISARPTAGRGPSWPSDCRTGWPAAAGLLRLPKTEKHSQFEGELADVGISRTTAEFDAISDAVGSDTRRLV